MSPFFVVGIPRSGTTLLSSMLNTHSELSIGPETHYFDRFWRKCRRAACLSDSTRFEEHAYQFLNSYAAAGRDKALGSVEAIAERLFASGERSHRVLLEATLGSRASNLRKSVWGEKTPVHVDYLPQILEEFPEARIIHILRDPRDVLLSLRSVPWGRRGRLFYLLWWRRCARLRDAVPGLDGNNLLEVRYEDLLARPEETLRRICKFIGVMYEPAMTGFDLGGQPPFDAAVEPWKRKNLEPLDPRNTGKWRARMTYAEASMVRLLLGASLTRKGYERGPSPGVSSFAMLGYTAVEFCTQTVAYWWRRLRNRLRGGQRT